MSLRPLRTAALMLALIAAPSCLVERIALASTLPVGMYPSYPPLDMRDPQSQRFQGFDVDLSQALIQRMGYTPQVVETSFAQLIPSLLTARIQMFFNGMMDTPARRQTIAFVDYLQSGMQFITLRNDDHAPRTMDEICGKAVAASRITSEPATLIAWSDRNCASRHKPPVELFAAENSVDSRLQLREGRVAAVLQDSLTVPWIIEINDKLFEPLGEPFDLTPLGIGLPRSDKNLICQTTIAFRALQLDGTYAALIRKWHLSASSAIDPAVIPQECSANAR